MYNRTQLTALLIIIILAGTVSGQDNFNTTLIGQWANGPCHTVNVSGSYAYVTDASVGLHIMDVSTPSSPQEVGFFDGPGDYTSSVAISGSYAYVAGGWPGPLSVMWTSLFVIDVSDPSLPQEVGGISLEDYALFPSVAINGSYAHVTDGRTGLRIIDISSPSLSHEVGFLDIGRDAKSIAVSGSYAYVIGGAGLRIIDISSPSLPQEVGFFDVQGDNPLSVAISGSYAYVAAASVGLRIIDVFTPSSPQEVGFFATDGSARDVAVSGSYAYVTDGGTGLRIIDISSPSLPQEVGFFATDSSAIGVTVSGNYAYVAAGDSGMYIIQNDLLVSVDDDNSHPGGIAFGANGTVFLANGGGGLRAYSPEDTSYINAATIQVGGDESYAKNVAIGLDGNVFLANGLDGLRAFSYDGDSFVNTAHIDDGGSANNVAVGPDGTVFLANRSDGLRAYSYDGSTFINTAHVDDGSNSASSLDVVVGQNGAIFVAIYNDGLRAYQYDGSSLTNTAHIEEGGTAVAVGPNGTVFFSGGDGLYAYNYDDSTFITTASLSSAPYAVRLSVCPDGTILLANGDGQLFAYSYDGTAITQIAHIGWPGLLIEIWGLNVAPDGKIFVSYQDDGTDFVSVYLLEDSTFIEIAQIQDWDQTTGLSLYEDETLLQKYTLHQNYPNPFNPSTEIRFDIPTARDVQLRIYNQLGQTVRTLVDNRMKAGTYALEWDGQDQMGRSVASGVYFYNLEAGDFNQIRKMTLVK